METTNLTGKARAILNKGRDKNHAIGHVRYLLMCLNEFLASQPDPPKVNLDILTVAIYWHDIWKSDYPIHNIFDLIITQILDGPASAFCFLTKNFSEAIPLGAKLSIFGCIFCHSLPYRKFTRAFSLESKLLSDIDTLAEWDVKRLKALENDYSHKGKISRKMLWLAEIYYRFFMFPKNESLFFFPYFREKYRIKRNEFEAYVRKLMTKYLL